MKKAIELTAMIWKEEHGYTALCPQLDIASQGRTKTEASKHLKEAVELYLEETHKIKHLPPATCTTLKITVS